MGSEWRKTMYTFCCEIVFVFRKIECLLMSVWPRLSVLSILSLFQANNNTLYSTFRQADTCILHNGYTDLTVFLNCKRNRQATSCYPIPKVFDVLTRMIFHVRGKSRKEERKGEEVKLGLFSFSTETGRKLELTTQRSSLRRRGRGGERGACSE